MGILKVDPALAKDETRRVVSYSLFGTRGRLYDPAYVPDDTSGKVSGGWLDTLYRWFKGGPPPPRPSPAGASDDAAERLPSRIGHYAIRRKLGAGGMGVVYEADDERLKRSVALKMMLSLPHDEAARRRFWREARAAASVNHPHVCLIYEVG